MYVIFTFWSDKYSEIDVHFIVFFLFCLLLILFWSTAFPHFLLWDYIKWKYVLQKVQVKELREKMKKVLNILIRPNHVCLICCCCSWLWWSSLFCSYICTAFLGLGGDNSIERSIQKSSWESLMPGTLYSVPLHEQWDFLWCFYLFHY